MDVELGGCWHAGCELGCRLLARLDRVRDVFLHPGARLHTVRSNGRLTNYITHAS